MGDKYQVKSIEHRETYEWLLHKHYAHRIPSISYAFGLFDGNILCGVCTFGQPASSVLKSGSMGKDYKGAFLELNRLVVKEGLPKNTLSFFVSRCLKELPKPVVIVSYADTAHNHHGYIYQATNWIYTGLSAKRTDYLIKGEENKHGRHQLDGNTEKGKKRSSEEVHNMLADKYGEGNFERIERSRKHRYFMLLGSKTERKRMRKNLKYEEVPYPKGDNIRYDASYQPSVQLSLF